jgi:hypothetical protein
MSRASAVRNGSTVPWIAGLAEKRIAIQAWCLIRVSVQMNNAPDAVGDLLIKRLISSFGLQPIGRCTYTSTDMIVAVHLVRFRTLQSGIRALNAYVVQSFIV